MPIKVTSGFSYSNSAPLDDRLVVLAVNDLASLVAYKGMIVYVIDDKCHYFYNDSEAWEKLKIQATWTDYLE